MGLLRLLFGSVEAAEKGQEYNSVSHMNFLPPEAKKKTRWSWGHSHIRTNFWEEEEEEKGQARG